MAGLARSPARMRRVHTLTPVALGLALVLWASAFAGIRAGLKGYGPGELALLRFLVASFVLALYARLRRLPRPQPRDLPALAGLGVVGITVYQVALTSGERTVSAGVASLLVASAPVFTALFALALFGEQARARGWAGMALSLGGVGAISVAQTGTAGLRISAGTPLVLVAAIAESAYFVLQKPYLARYGGLAVATYTIWAATASMLVYVPGLVVQVRAAPVGATLAVVYLGVFPAAVAYVAWSWALARAEASVVASSLYLLPPISILIARVWLGETPTMLSLLGGLVTILGVALINTGGTRPGAASTSAGAAP